MQKIKKFIIIILLYFLINHTNAWFVSNINSIIDKNYTVFCEKRFENIINFDIRSDNSYQKILNKKIWFENLGYKPSDLIKIAGNGIINKNNNKIRQIAWYYLLKMSDEFFLRFDTKIVINSAYRNTENQKLLYGKISKKYVAYPWHSEHQIWLAIDIWYSNKKKISDYYLRLSQNAHKYWFHNTYRKWIKIDEYNPEPRHWRFVWIEFASYLYQKDLTLNEYYNLQKEKLNNMWYKNTNIIMNFYKKCKKI